MDFWTLWMLCVVSLLAKEGCSELFISDCKEGRVDVVEDKTYSFTCDTYFIWGPVWTIYGDKGELLYRGSCQRSICTSMNDNFVVDEQYKGEYDDSYYYTSRLIIPVIKRDSARTLNCSSLSQSTVCELRIIATPLYDDCSVSISNWMVTGSCTLERMYSSDNNYYCKWRESGNNNEEFGGFQTEPASYTEHNLRIYMKGVCSFAKPMPLTSGRYTYTITVLPGGVYFQRTIHIDEPYQVQLHHSCPKYVYEGSSISCTCSASRAVTPPALLVWEGRNDSTLLLANVSRQQNEEQFTCQLKWGPDGSIKENTSYTPTVAYGPSDAVITSHKKKTEDESETISLTCTATDVYPSAVFQWNFTCYNQTDYRDSSTCFLNSTQKFENLTILCTASNKYFSQSFVSHGYVLLSLENMQANTTWTIAVIGGVSSAVLVLIIVAILIVYIIKMRKGILDTEKGFLGIFSGPRKHSNQGPEMSQPYAVVNHSQTQSQTPIRRQAGPSGDMYTITSTTCTGHVEDDYAAVCETYHMNTGGSESNGVHQGTLRTKESLEQTIALKSTSKPMPALNNKTNIQGLHGTVYMNVTEVLTDSGLGVYHVVPWATMSGSAEPETNEYEYSVPTNSEDEYNELHFEEDRTGQEDHDDNYHHLQIT